MLSTHAIWTSEFLCEFDHRWYPFDTQNCFMHFSTDGNNLKLRVGNVSYKGKEEIGKYQIKKINFCDTDKNGKNGIFVDITYNSPMTGYIMTLFLPTGMLLPISQVSSTYDSKYFELIIEINTTLLLVLTTL